MTMAVARSGMAVPAVAFVFPAIAVIKLASARQTETLQQLALSGQEAGRKYIHAASALLNAS